MDNSLIDTGFLFAVFDDKDSHHKSCSVIFEDEIAAAILPDIIIPEMAYLRIDEIEGGNESA